MAKKEAKPQLAKNAMAMRLLSQCIRQGLPDHKIQDRLEHEIGYRWNIATIRARRRALGIIKGSKAEIDISALDAPPPGLDYAEKVQWFTDQFMKSHMYANLQRHLKNDEIPAYLDEYGKICCQFEDIVLTEYFQIDEFLKHRILIDRQMSLIKNLNELLGDVEKDILESPLSEDATKEQRMVHIDRIRRRDDIIKRIDKSNERYDKLEIARDRIYRGLAATRRDRIDELKGGKENFMDIVTAIQTSKDERDKQGKYAELSRLAANDIEKEFRKPQEFPDGSSSPIIMDSETLFDEE